jgi:hypothetical protein
VIPWENPDMRAKNLVGAMWRKSSFSTANSECVEISSSPEVVAARDSKNPAGPVLVFAPAPWSTFLGNI